jgi:hypothetical protein
MINIINQQNETLFEPNTLAQSGSISKLLKPLKYVQDEDIVCYIALTAILLTC